jgi:hypothetical protein
MSLPFLRTVTCAILVSFVSACHTRTRVALPEGSPPAAGEARDVALNVNDSVRVTLRDGSQLNGLVSAIERDALTLRRGRDSTRPADDRRILWSDIVQIEREKVSATRTTLLVLSPVITLGVALLVGMLFFALSPNGGR